MALTRAKLKAFNLTEEVIEEIISDHVDTVNGLKDERDHYREVAAKYDGARAELEEMKKATEGDSWKVKYDALKEDFESYKAERKAHDVHEAKKAAYRDALKEAGVSDKRIDAVLKVSDVDSIELDDDGHIMDADSLKNHITSEWADFITTTKVKGAEVATPQSVSTAKPQMSKEDIMKIADRSERRKAIAANPEAFGIRTNGAN